MKNFGVPNYDDEGRCFLFDIFSMVCCCCCSLCAMKRFCMVQSGSDRVQALAHARTHTFMQLSNVRTYVYECDTLINAFVHNIFRPLPMNKVRLCVCACKYRPGWEKGKGSKNTLQTHNKNDTVDNVVLHILSKTLGVKCVCV